MSNISFGEDLIAVLIAVGLISTFLVVLEDSIGHHRKMKESKDELKNLVITSNYLEKGGSKKNKDFDKLGVLSESEIRNSIDRLNSWNSKFGKIGLRIGSLNNEILYSTGDMSDSAKSVTLPIVYERNGEKNPAKIIFWRVES